MILLVDQCDRICYIMFHLLAIFNKECPNALKIAKVGLKICQILNKAFLNDQRL